jgi:hypothetical protein
MYLPTTLAALLLCAGSIARAQSRDSLEIAGRPIIEAVQKATIQFPDGRKSSVSVRNAIHWNEWTGKYKPGTWSAQRASADEWTVSLRSSDRNDRAIAQWSHNTATQQTRPLDALAERLSYRSVPVLPCAIAAEAIAATLPVEQRIPPTVTRLAVLPVPVPPVDAAFKLEAVFVVDAAGVGDLVEWTRPNDPTWAKKVAESLLAYTFRPALDHEGKPTCGRAIIRVQMQPPRR